MKNALEKKRQQEVLGIKLAEIYKLKSETKFIPGEVFNLQKLETYNNKTRLRLKLEDELMKRVF